MYMDNIKLFVNNTKMGDFDTKNNIQRGYRNGI